MKKKPLALFACALLFAALAGAFGHAAAQSAPAKVLVTWQADTYVPAGFSGKVMPASDSAIMVGVDLVDLAKRVDLATYKIYWYIDEKFYQGAVGLTRISFNAPHLIGDNAIRVRVLIVDYKTGIGTTITIPVVTPEVVIQSSAPDLAASAAPFNIQAYPYFFNVTDASQLDFNWSLNGVNVGNQNPFVATKDMASKGAATLSLSLSNPARLIERITQKLTIFR